MMTAEEGRGRGDETYSGTSLVPICSIGDRQYVVRIVDCSTKFAIGIASGSSETTAWIAEVKCIYCWNWLEKIGMWCQRSMFNWDILPHSCF